MNGTPRAEDWVNYELPARLYREADRRFGRRRQDSPGLTPSTGLTPHQFARLHENRVNAQASNCRSASSTALSRLCERYTSQRHRQALAGSPLQHGLPAQPIVLRAYGHRDPLSNQVRKPSVPPHPPPPPPPLLTNSWSTSDPSSGHNLFRSALPIMIGFENFLRSMPKGRLSTARRPDGRRGADSAAARPIPPTCSAKASEAVSKAQPIALVPCRPHDPCTCGSGKKFNSAAGSEAGCPVR